MPDVAAGRHPGARIRLRELKVWLETLRGGHPLLVCRELKAQLEILARFPDPLPALPELLELFAEPVHNLHTHTNEIMDAPFNAFNSRAAQQVLNAYSQVLVELGYLHKRFINHLLDTTEGPPAGYLVDAMELFAWQIQIHITRYQTTPIEFWKDMLQVYRIAEFTGCMSELVKRRDRTQTSIHTLFFGCLLFQVCDTLQLTPQLTWQLFLRAAQLANTLELRPVESCQDGIPVDTSGEIAPFEYARRTLPNLERGSRRLYVGELIRVLSALVDNDKLADLISRDLKELQHAQHGGKFRRTTR